MTVIVKQPKIYNVPWKEIYRRIDEIKTIHVDAKYYGVPRGGQVIAGLLGTAVEDPQDADVIVDDLYDSGETANRWRTLYPDKPFVVLFDKKNEPALNNVWLKFPWEGTHDSDIRDHVIRLLQQHNTEPTEERIEIIASTVFRLTQAWNG